MTHKILQLSNTSVVAEVYGAFPLSKFAHICNRLFLIVVYYFGEDKNLLSAELCAYRHNGPLNALRGYSPPLMNEFQLTGILYRGFPVSGFSQPTRSKVGHFKQNMYVSC